MLNIGNLVLLFYKLWGIRAFLLSAEPVSMVFFKCRMINLISVIHLWHTFAMASVFSLTKMASNLQGELNYFLAEILRGCACISSCTCARVWVAVHANKSKRVFYLFDRKVKHAAFPLHQAPPIFRTFHDDSIYFSFTRQLTNLYGC